jgi:phosphoglycerate kinase
MTNHNPHSLAGIRGQRLCRVDRVVSFLLSPAIGTYPWNASMRTLESLDVGNQRALIRADLNVPLADDLTIQDDTRIRAALPTLEHVLQRGGRCVLMAHLGRPGGQRVPRLRLAPVAVRLAELLPDHDVRSCEDIIGERARQMAATLPTGSVLVLENVRFHPGEQEGDERFARELSTLGEIFINDAFGACHRRHASVYGVARQFARHQRAAGLLVEREVRALARVVEDPATPVVALFGGAKVSDKLDAVRALLDRVDRILIGGAMTYTFMRAQGHETGNSKVEAEQVEVARAILLRAGDRLWLPSDHVVARSLGPDTGGNLARDGIADGWQALDIGPETIGRYRNEIARAATLIWNGPMGRVERDAYLEGTRRIAEAIAESVVERGATAVAGGGETGAVVRRLGLHDRLTHISTGGGAFLEYIARGTLPALEVLS